MNKINENEHGKRHRPRAFQQKAYQSARRQSTSWQGLSPSIR
jgi:hypothetical protein